MRRWPCLGFLSERTGTIFIDRNRRSDTQRITQKVVQLLQQGETIAAFPEAKTSDGKQVHHFHASLLESVVLTQGAVRPLCLSYKNALGEITTAPAYIENVSLLACVNNILRAAPITVHLTVLPRIPVSDHLHRKALAQASQKAIQQALTAGVK